MTAHLDLKDITAAADTADISESADPADPIDSSDANDPTEPIERAEPTDPIDRTDPFEAIDSRESSDQSDNSDVRCGFVMRSSLAQTAVLAPIQGRAPAGGIDVEAMDEVTPDAVEEPLGVPFPVEVPGLLRPSRVLPPPGPVAAVRPSVDARHASTDPAG